MRLSWCKCGLCALLLLCIQLCKSVQIVYDETLWTKQTWAHYKIDPGVWGQLNPADEVIKQTDLRSAVQRATLDSLDGSAPRRAASASIGFWTQDHAVAGSSSGGGFTAMSSADQASFAAQCPTCHEILTQAWKQVVKAVNKYEPVNEVSIRDLLEDACDGAPSGVLDRHTIKQVEASAGFLTGAVWFAVRERPAGGEAPTHAERIAVARACQDLLSSSLQSLSKAAMEAAKGYFREASEIIHKHDVAKRRAALASDSDDDEYEDPAPSSGDDLAKEAEEEARAMACRDQELMCASWAAVGECAANPVYMTGAGRHRGHCELSCGMFDPDVSWRSDPKLMAELDAAALAAGSKLTASACSSSQVCLTGGGATTPGGGGPAKVTFVEKEPETTPGAILAKLPGFVLGKPFWGRPKVSPPPPIAKSIDTRPDPDDPADVALHAEMGNKVLSIMGMDGFFRYDLLFRQRVYQFHAEKSGDITEQWTLGLYDRDATVAAKERDAVAPPTKAKLAWADARRAAAREGGVKASSVVPEGSNGRSGGEPGKGQAATKPEAGGRADDGVDGIELPPAPPMLDALDLLPDQPSMMLRSWPFVRQLYTRGDACGAEGRSRPRRVELRVACSPDGSLSMLVREPEFCSYIAVVFSPALCKVPGYQPVRFLPLAGPSGSGQAEAAPSGAADEAGDPPAGHAASASTARRKRGGRRDPPGIDDIGPSPAVVLGDLVEPSKATADVNGKRKATGAPSKGGGAPGHDDGVDRAARGTPSNIASGSDGAAADKDTSGESTQRQGHPSAQQGRKAGNGGTHDEV